MRYRAENDYMEFMHWIYILRDLNFCQLVWTVVLCTGRATRQICRKTNPLLLPFSTALGLRHILSAWKT